MDLELGGKVAVVTGGNLNPRTAGEFMFPFLLGAVTALFLIVFTHLSFSLTGTNEFCG